MSNTAVPSASRINLAPTPSASWHVGLSPKFPSSLTLSDDAAIESLVMDIPFLSVGLLGFGVLTFFFAMRKFNRLAFFAFASVIVAFIAGVLDVGQVLTRGEAAAAKDTNVSSVLPLLISREVALALSIGLRFLFFWTFVSRAPRGERHTARASQEQRPNFLRMDSDVHSGDWARWGIVGTLFKYTLLLATIAIPVLQLLWRLIAQFSTFGPLYNADAALEIVVSALFILKLFANAWLSPLTPRWKTIRDYFPVIMALFFGLGVEIGNILCFQFSETSLGRFLQAVELYIIVIYVLISAFYHQRHRISMVVDAQKLRSLEPSPFEGIETDERQSTFRITPPSVSTPEPVGDDQSLRTITPVRRPSNKRLSSWLPDAGTLPERAGGPRRASTTGRLTSWLMSRRGSGRRDREQSRLWNKEDMEAGTSPVDEKTGYAASFDGSPAEPRETTLWKDPVYTSVGPSARQRLEQITTALEAQPSKFTGNSTSPDGTISEFNIDRYGTDSVMPPRRPQPPGSPVYGLDGVRYRDRASSPLARPGSTESSGMESLLRQQAELDKSVAELQMFSSSPRLSTSTYTAKLSAPSGHPESFRSEFSLSNFPEPPLGLADEFPRNTEATSMDDSVPLKLPRMPAVAADLTRQQSFPLDADMTGRSALESNGTQYDVTSFIGNLTTPGMKDSFSQGEKLKPLVEQPSSDNDTGAAVADPVYPTARAQIPPSGIVVAEEVARPAGLPAGPRRGRQALPPRSRLNISGPINRGSVEKSSAYERPRPVPAP